MKFWEFFHVYLGSSIDVVIIGTMKEAKASWGQILCAIIFLARYFFSGLCAFITVRANRVVDPEG